MKRIRNPRFAIESLEKKLCPSGFGGHSGASALYSTPNPAPTQDNPSSSDDGADQHPASDNTDSTDLTVSYDIPNDPGPVDSNNDNPALIGAPQVILVTPGMSPSPSDSDSALVPPPGNDPGFDNSAYADPGSDNSPGDVPAPGPDDPADPDDPIDPADPADPVAPGPLDDPGQIPFVPLPPAPIGPEVQAY